MSPKRSKKTSVAPPPVELDSDGSECEDSDVSMADNNDTTPDDQPEASASKRANNAPNPTTRPAKKKKPKRRHANEQQFGNGQLHQEFAAFRRLFQVFLDRTMPQGDGSTAMDVAMKPLSSRRPDCVVKTSFEPAESRKKFTGYYTEWMKALKQLDNVYHQVREIFVYDDYVNFTFKTPDAANSFTPNKEDMFKALGSKTPVSCFQRADEHYYVELFFRGRDFRHTYASDAKKMLAELGLNSDKFSVIFREKSQRFIANFTDMAEADRLLELYENEGGTQGEGLLIDYSYAHLRFVLFLSLSVTWHR
ncbi:hypothetical protein CGCS363_v002580 [Colletotrichum siamense]|uniref:uncharacterized protein n=1 Tax=Colletotrichum siamense TaxID=690259 RepID=UPI0018724DA2|nr:uncharacterized protein CGCS363_v002580 [Colletotrichum siamense]KAF5511339.1 hypothetical protein CGCS363_v002580 [Colletotrichum siamense]